MAKKISKEKGVSPSVNEEVVGEHSRVAISYIGTLEDGEVFDRSQDGNPLVFKMGEGELLPDFEKAIRGMHLNSEKEIHLKPEQAYGFRNENLIQEIPLALFEGKLKPERGMRIMFNMQGRRLYAQVLEVKKETALLDFNHPLAGKSLNFKVKVLKISED
ncbi:MAG: peptidylprolyl isomerase [Candidatus Woesearchaeota archaeon]